MIKNKEQSLWFKMLEKKVSSKLDRTGNVFVFGDPSSGKKKLIQGIQECARTKAMDRRRNFDGDWEKRDLDNVYIMDFKYLTARQVKDDDSEEIGKINFYIFNRKYDFLKDFLTKEILHNLMIVIVLDLESPQNLQESMENWLGFAQKSIYSYITDLPEETQKEYQNYFSELNKKIKEFGTYGADSKVKVAMPKEIIKEDPLEDQPEEVIEREVHSVQLFNIPLVIIGNKSDVLESTSSEALKEHIEFVLREINIKNQSILFTSSMKNDWNINLLSQFLLYSLLDKQPEDSLDVRENLSLTNLYIKSTNDGEERLKTAFPSHEPYNFPSNVPILKKDATVESSEIRSINDFLADLNVGNFSKTSEAEDLLYKSQNFSASMIGGFNTALTGNSNSTANPRGDRIRDILGRNRGNP